MFCAVDRDAGRISISDGLGSLSPVFEVSQGPNLALPSGVYRRNGFGIRGQPFNENLNDLHSAAEALTGQIRSGQVPRDLQDKLISNVPPIVFRPEFHQEIEQVRKRTHQSLVSRPPVPLYARKQSI